MQLQQIQKDIEVVGSRKRSFTFGPIDTFASVINPDFSNDGSKQKQQQNIHDAFWKEIAHQVDYICDSMGLRSQYSFPCY